MKTAVDTNVLIALWNSDDALNTLARAALDRAADRGALVIAAPVFAELLAGRTEAFVDGFLRETGIEVDWNLGEGVWRLAGNAFRRYVARRGTQRQAGPRRILADFVIGAHALHNHYQLLTLDERLYRASFQQLPIAAL
jgi:predicted nucleic acid-binding protein